LFVKEGENIALTLHSVPKFEPDTEIGQKGAFCKGLGIPKRYSIHVNGPWCITFEWEEGEALRVDLEQYH